MDDKTGSHDIDHNIVTIMINIFSFHNKSFSAVVKCYKKVELSERDTVE